MTVRAAWANGVLAALLMTVVAAITGTTGLRLVEYFVLGAVVGTVFQLIGVHSVAEAVLRPVRVDLIGDTEIGDTLPRPHPTFAWWSNASMLSVAFVFSVSGAILAVVFVRIVDAPLLVLIVGCVLTLVLAVPLTIGAVSAP